MAKISARGDRELKRYTATDGRVLVLTEKGRVLRKLTSSSGYNLLDTSLPKGDRAKMVDAFDQIARAMGYVEPPAAEAPAGHPATLTEGERTENLAALHDRFARAMDRAGGVSADRDAPVARATAARLRAGGAS